MGELRSAWEIAEERAKRLGKLSPEEVEEQERERHREIGRALAQKYLDAAGGLDIAAEVNKYDEGRRSVVKQSAIEHLAKALQLTNIQTVGAAKKIVAALATLEPNVKGRLEQIDQLIREYEKAEQRIRQELEDKRREILHQLRISGTAIDAINMEADEEWRAACQELGKSFAPRLSELKQGLFG